MPNKYKIIKQLLQRFQDRYLNRKLIFVMDVALSTLVSVLIILLSNLFANSNTYSGRFFWIYVAMAFVLSGFLVYFSKCYRIIIRHLQVKDLLSFALVSLAKGILLAVGIWALRLWTPYIPIIVTLDFLATALVLIAVRLNMILVYDRLNSSIRNSKRLTKVLLYGISNKSVAIIPRLKNSQHYQAVGFLVRDKSLNDIKIEGKDVYSFANDSEFSAILDKTGANGVMFAVDTDAREENHGLLDYCSEHNVKTLIAPSFDEIKAGKNVFRPRDIKIEDLLGREEIKIDMDAVKAMLGGKTILVTGAAGSIGSEIVRQLAKQNVRQIILYDNAETPLHNLRLELEGDYPQLDFTPVIGDVREAARLDYVFRRFQPQIVFHAAAYKHVPLMEENPCEAILVNLMGSRNVADKCIEYGIEKMVMLSTDKAVNPTNIMGCSKRLAEIYTQSLGLAIEKGRRKGKTTFITTRFGNVLGSNGSVIPRFREQIAEGGPVTVTHPDINRFFMSIPEACRLVMEAATIATGTQVFVFDMGEPVKIDTLARRMITLAGYVPDRDIKVEYTGLRPGEKLYEELLANEENTIKTQHQRIRIAKVREYNYDDAAMVADRLTQLAREVNIPEMVKMMKSVVPEYISNNSRFEEYDKKDK
ncbi:MAG: polysaccharide biosynthesis protein [Bacteroidales bacterium]|nr:polysaccharide biosynthesis protein [Bacteroidales bacterium]